MREGREGGREGGREESKYFSYRGGVMKEEWREVCRGKG